MYIPDHFAPDAALVDELLRNHGAADLVTVTEQGLVATMLPFIYVPDSGPHGALHGHLARNNDQWKRRAAGESLAIVRGPDAYISPGWYASKVEHGRVVPTWNYVTACVYGRLVVPAMTRCGPRTWCGGSPHRLRRPARTTHGRSTTRRGTSSRSSCGPSSASSSRRDHQDRGEGQAQPNQ